MFDTMNDLGSTDAWRHPPGRESWWPGAFGHLTKIIAILLFAMMVTGMPHASLDGCASGEMGVCGP